MIMKSKRGVDDMSMKNVPVVFNIEDPEQLALYTFLKTLPNGKKRNASNFLRMLVDREYQKQKNEGSVRVSSKGSGGIRIDLTNKHINGPSS